MTLSPEVRKCLLYAAALAKSRCDWRPESCIALAAGWRRNHMNAPPHYHRVVGQALHAYRTRAFKASRTRAEVVAALEGAAES